METMLSTPATRVFTPASPLEMAVGNTPLLPLQRIGAHLPPHVQVFAKAEWFNPGGSVKDRPALHILRTALANGLLANGRRLLDSTSGNMGIAYATFGASLSIPVTLALPQNASPERISILRALGAELVLTDPLEGSDGAIRVARQLAAEQPDRYYYANQYDNPACWQAHYLTTGPEIYRQTNLTVTHFVAGMGTTGTITGTGRCLRECNPWIQIIGVQPSAPFHGLEGLKHLETAMQPGIFDPSILDHTLAVSTEAARQMVLRLARQEGLFVGVSAGAAAAAALQVAQEAAELDQPATTVTLFPDAGYKYLSDKKLWESHYD